jgi:phosphatidylglycerophosphate synthase
MWKTWANLLTAIRTISIFPCAWAIVTGAWTIAAGLFTLAVLTDLLDGPLARHFNHASGLGGLLDHATDAAFVTVTLAALAWVDYGNWLLPPLIAGAFAQYVLDSRVLAGQQLRTSWLGKHNGILYFVLAGVPIIRNALALSWPADIWITLFSWLLVATTLVSILDRLRALLHDRTEP